ncbi:MAG TPA: hypothetical protein VE262_14000 [Blastocatellia bacterium]|nr:hypothetical protein [Blastocatellia bacterium]
MKLDDPEKELRATKYHHLTEDELDSYHDQTLDEIGQARVRAHLKLCLICDERLELLREESAALNDREVNAGDVELVRRVMQQMGLQKPKPASPLPLQARLAEYFRQAVMSWRAHFMPAAVRGAGHRGAGDSGEEVWHWQSEDGILKARATLERNADLVIHISSSESALDLVRLKIRLGLFSEEITLRRVSNSEISARVEIPRRQRPKNLSDISIEAV